MAAKDINLSQDCWPLSAAAEKFSAGGRARLLLIEYAQIRREGPLFVRSDANVTIY